MCGESVCKDHSVNRWNIDNSDSTRMCDNCDLLRMKTQIRNGLNSELDIIKKKFSRERSRNN